jgi:hypothetical protein
MKQDKYGNTIQHYYFPDIFKDQIIGQDNQMIEKYIAAFSVISKLHAQIKLFSGERKGKFFSQITAQKFVAPRPPSATMADLSARPPATATDPSPLDMDCEAAVLHVSQFIQSSDDCPADIVLPDFSPLSNSEFLDKVAELLLIPSLTECVCIAFFPVLTDLVGRWARLGEDSIGKVACALGRLIHIQPKLKRYFL